MLPQVRPWSLPPRSFPERGTLPLPPRPALPLRNDRDPPLGSSKAGGSLGDPEGYPPGPWRVAAERGEAGGGREARRCCRSRGGGPGTRHPRPRPARTGLSSRFPFARLRAPSASCSEAGSSRPLQPPPHPRRSLARPAGPSAGSVFLSLFHSPSFPFPVPSSLLSPGVPGQGLRAGQWR